MNATINMSVIETPENYEGLTHGVSYFFNSDRFLKLRTGLKTMRFNLIKNGLISASIVFVIDHHRAISGYKATFGSFDLADNLTEGELATFIMEIEEHLKNSGIAEIEIRNWPANYPYFRKINDALSILSYDCKVQEINQHLLVSAVPFSELVCYNELKKLNQSMRQGFSFRQLGSDDISSAYELVIQSRARKGYPVTMSLADLYKAFGKCPGDYLLFGVFDDDLLIATAVSIKLNREIIYNFYHADHSDYRSFSPTVLLLSGIYLFCQSNGFNFLDLGISTSNGLVNKGLFRFKENVGCEKSNKSTFSKSI